jgi:hypothetical protein
MARLAICESCPSIDVRQWHREGRLEPGQRFSWSWMAGSITVQVECAAVVLSYRYCFSGSNEWKSIQQRVPISLTACHFGGQRPWFVCSAYCNGRHCGRRVAVLYAAGDLFACRRCYLRQSAGDPTKSAHPPLAKDQNEARWQSRSATAISEKAAWNAPAHVPASSGA